MKDKLEIISIDVGHPIAVQPIAVSRRSRHRYLTRRLIEAVTTAVWDAENSGSPEGDRSLPIL